MVIITALELIFSAVNYHNEAEPLPANFVIIIFFEKLNEIAILTSVASIFLAQFSILRYPKNHGLFLIVTFILISGFLFSLINIEKNQNSYYQSPASPPPGEILIYSNKGLFTGNKEDEIYWNLIYADPTQERTLHYYSRGSYDAQYGKMTVYSEQSESTQDLHIGPFYNQLNKPRIITSISKDVQHLVNLTANIKKEGFLQSVFLILSITFFCIACWLLVKITKWPFINFLLVLLAGRFLIFIFSLFNNRHVLNFFNEILYEKYLPYLPSTFLFFIGTMLIIISLLLPPVSQWKKRVPYE
jgi:hypothetical protein